MNIVMILSNYRYKIIANLKNNYFEPK